LNATPELPAKPVAAAPAIAPPKPFVPLYDFVRTHVLIVNSLLTFTTFGVGWLDFFFSHRPEVGHTIYGVTAILAAVLLLAAIWPSFGYRVELMLFGRQAEGAKRGVFQFCAALFVLITFLGNISMAKAAQGGVISSKFPEMKTLQDELLGVKTQVEILAKKTDETNASVQKGTQQVLQSTEDLKKQNEEIKDTVKVIAAARTPAVSHEPLDPRIELRKRGYEISSGGVLDAISQHDKAALKWFAQAKFRVDDTIVLLNLFYQHWDPEIADLLTEEMFANENACIHNLNVGDDLKLLMPLYSKALRPTNLDQARTFKRLCKSRYPKEVIEMRVNNPSGTPEEIEHWRWALEFLAKK